MGLLLLLLWSGTPAGAISLGIETETASEADLASGKKIPNPLQPTEESLCLLQNRATLHVNAQQGMNGQGSLTLETSLRRTTSYRIRSVATWRTSSHGRSHPATSATRGCS